MTDAEIRAVEAENKELQVAIDAARMRFMEATNDSFSAKQCRDLELLIEVREEEAKALGDQCTLQAQRNDALKTAAEFEAVGGTTQKLLQLQNEIGMLEVQLQELRSDNVGLKAIKRRQKKAIQSLEAKERAHQRQVNTIMADIQAERDRTAPLEASPEQEEELKRFRSKLRAEQEQCMKLTRLLRKAKTRAEDSTSLVVLQRKVAVRQSKWEIERAEMYERLDAIESRLEDDKEAADKEICSTESRITDCEEDLVDLNEKLAEADLKISGFQVQTKLVRDHLREFGLFVSDSIPMSSEEASADVVDGQARGRQTTRPSRSRSRSPRRGQSSRIASSRSPRPQHHRLRPTASSRDVEPLRSPPASSSKAKDSEVRAPTSTNSKPRFQGRKGRFVAA